MCDDEVAALVVDNGAYTTRKTISKYFKKITDRQANDMDY